MQSKKSYRHGIVLQVHTSLCPLPRIATTVCSALITLVLAKLNGPIRRMDVLSRCGLSSRSEAPTPLRTYAMTIGKRRLAMCSWSTAKEGTVGYHEIDMMLSCYVLYWRGSKERLREGLGEVGWYVHNIRVDCSPRHLWAVEWQLRSFSVQIYVYGGLVRSVHVPWEAMNMYIKSNELHSI
jgi:hypothetical protein